MMKVETKFIVSSNKSTRLPIRVYFRRDRDSVFTLKPNATLLFVHGMFESIDDYDSMARYFVGKGYAVVMPEVLGCGRALVDGISGYMGRNGTGFIHAIEDVARVYREICCGFLSPVVLVGFSLGSYIIREALVLDKFDKFLAGVCLVGTGNKSSLEIAIGKLITKRRIHKYGARCTEGVMEDLVVEGYSRKFRSKERFSWLFRDRECLESFNPGDYTVTPQMFYDLLCSMQICSKSIGDDLKRVPLMLLSGSEDLVTGRIERLVSFFKRYGCPNISAYSILGYRHAVLRDGCSLVAFECICSWIERTVLGG